MSTAADQGGSGDQPMTLRPEDESIEDSNVAGDESTFVTTQTNEWMEVADPSLLNAFEILVVNNLKCIARRIDALERRVDTVMLAIPSFTARSRSQSESIVSATSHGDDPRTAERIQKARVAEIYDEFTNMLMQILETHLSKGGINLVRDAKHLPGQVKKFFDRLYEQFSMAEADDDGTGQSEPDPRRAIFDTLDEDARKSLYVKLCRAKHKSARGEKSKDKQQVNLPTREGSCYRYKTEDT